MKLFSILKTIAAVVGACLLLGFGIGSNTPMPGYAPLYLDDLAKTYVALPCLDEWHHRQSESVAVLRLSTAAEAYKLKYRPDDDCRETGAFMPDGPSLTGFLLVKLGIVAPPRYWWDSPYRTEEGVVVQPGRSP